MKKYPARKVTGWLTNSRCIADELENFQCENRTKREHVCQDVYDDVTGKMLPGHLVRAARQEEIKFLSTFLVHKKVSEANAKGKERVSVQWCDVNEATVATWQSDHGMWEENLGERIRSCRQVCLSLGCRLVDVFGVDTACINFDLSPFVRKQMCRRRMERRSPRL